MSAVSANAAYTPVISRFDRLMARHLAARVAAGVHCIEPVVRECYVDTCRDLQMTRVAANSPCVDELEACFVHKVAEMMACHQRFIGSMPEAIASTFISELLLEKPW
jgi:hypothetical protein